LDVSGLDSAIRPTESSRSNLCGSSDASARSVKSIDPSPSAARRCESRVSSGAAASAIARKMSNTVLEEWAHIRDWTSDDQRRAAYDGFMHFYNHHRSHGALGWHTPMATLTQLARDNLPEEHI
jgi:transposase InsO family protein